MRINSLGIDYSGETIITDIDDCLVFTTKSIKSNNINKKKFWFNNDIYKKNKSKIFLSAELTEWGREFIHLTSNGIIKDFILITSAFDRKELIIEKFKIKNTLLILEGYSSDEKIEFLNTFPRPLIYVDDKLRVINKLKKEIQSVNYPKTKIIKYGKLRKKRR